MELVYEPKTENWALQPDICNSNNHASDITMEEYRVTMSKTNKDRWVKVFPDPPDSIEIPLTVSMCKILAQASRVGYLKNARPSIFKEELEDIEKYIASFMANTVVIKWFIRLNEASPKPVPGSGWLC